MQLIALIALAAAGLATATAAGTIDRNFHESFAATQGVVLRLDHGDGDVEIRPWDQQRVDIEVRYRATSRGIGAGQRDFDVDFEQRGNVISVTDREQSSPLVGSLRTYEHLYSIQAPPYVALEITGEDGDVEIRGWAADIDLDLEDGDIGIDGLRGELRAKVDDGDLDLRDCEGPTTTLQLEDGDVTVRGGGGSWSFTIDDGDLDASGLAAEAIRVRAQDGNIRLALSGTGALDVDLQTDDGDVSLGLPPSASARFDLAVDDGSISVLTTDTVIESSSKRSTRGVIGAGDGRIRITTQDGDIRIHDSD